MLTHPGPKRVVSRAAGFLRPTPLVFNFNPLWKSKSVSERLNKKERSRKTLLLLI